MTKRDRSAVKRIYTVFMAVVLILTSVMLGCFVKYIYNEQRNGAMADTVSGDTVGDDLKYQKISVTVGKKKDELIKLDGMMPVSADVKVEKGDSSKSDTLCAYDITIMDGVGKSFQPTEESPITVEIKNDVFSKCREKDLHLWHIDDAGIREEVTDFTVDGDSIIFAATGFSLYEVTAGEPQLCTYEFYTLDGNDTYQKYYYKTTSGKQICQQIIKKSDNLVTPQLPANESQKTFLGWYILQENGGILKATSTKVNFDDPQGFVSGGTVKIGAVYEDCVYLIFHDQYDDKLKSEPIVETRRGILNNGKAVISVDGVEVTYDDDKESSATHMVFAGWSTVRVEPGKSAALVGYNGNDFIGTVEVTENTELYPVFTECAWLSFSTGGIAQGAESIPQVMQNVNEPVEKLPVPERDGYSFEGWYTDDTFTKKIGDEQGHILSSIDASDLPGTMELKDGKIYLKEDTKLYAEWTAAETKYTVVIWRQSINDKVNTADDKKTYDYAESYSYNTITGTSASVPDDLKNMSGDDYKGFYYRACDSSKVVAGDRSTILNVYYDRMKVTYQFYTSNSYGTRAVNDMVGLYNQRLYDCGYTWPSVTNKNYMYYYEANDGSTMGMTYLDAFTHIEKENRSDTNGSTYITQKYYRDSNNNASNIYQIRQRLDGTYTMSSDLKNDAWTETHFVKSNNSQFGFSNKFNGFTVSYYSLGSFTTNPNLAATDGSSVPYNSNTYDLYVYNKRDRNKLVFTNPKDNTVYETKSVLYEDTLPQPDNVPEPPPGCKFKCWTYDREGNQAVDFENDKMPANKLAVYAQWEKLRYLVEIDPNGGKFEIQSDGEDNSGYSTWFWVNYDDTISEYKNVTRNYRMSQDGHYYYRYLDREYYDLGDEYSEGEASITDRSAGYTKEAKDATDLRYRYEEARDAYRYAGWYKVQEDGSEVPYQFDDPVRENTRLRLHWKALGTYYIKYEPGEGILDDQDHSEDQFKVMDDADYADKAHVVITRTVRETPDGKNFIGWRLRNDPSGNLYYPGGAFEFNSAYAEKVIDDEG
ncbi:MAG: InlB B-repeat-containing protein, partial [Ruminococcus sp.]|nr:InlB B-repeat-containing protein [Ruminococcus sp.]